MCQLISGRDNLYEKNDTVGYRLINTRGNKDKDKSKDPNTDSNKDKDKSKGANTDRNKDKDKSKDKNNKSDSSKGKYYEYIETEAKGIKHVQELELEAQRSKRKLRMEKLTESLCGTNTTIPLLVQRKKVADSLIRIVDNNLQAKLKIEFSQSIDLLLKKGDLTNALNVYWATIKGALDSLKQGITVKPAIGKCNPRLTKLIETCNKLDTAGIHAKLKSLPKDKDSTAIKTLLQLPDSNKYKGIVHSPAQSVKLALASLAKNTAKIKLLEDYFNSHRQLQLTDSVSLFCFPDMIKVIKENTEPLTATQQEIKALSANRKLVVSTSVDLEKRITAATNEIMRLKHEIKDNYDIQKFNYNVSSVQFEFNEGYILKIVVDGSYNSSFDCPAGGIDITQNKQVKFVNKIPLGFTTTADYDQLKNKTLYSMGGEIDFKMKLVHLLPQYLENVEVDRRDFSPADQKQTVTFSDSENSKKINLKKIDSEKLFEARVYSDFYGLTSQGNPNGIVQTEAEYRINLRTYRSSKNWGGWEYLIFSGGLTKIDKNDKNLPISSIDKFTAGNYTPVKFASTLDLRQREIYNLGFDLNAIVFDAPSIKSTFRLDAGTRFGRVSVSDSAKTFSNNTLTVNPKATIFGVSTWRFYPRISWEVLSDERISFLLSYSHMYYYAFTNDFNQVANNHDFLLNQKSQFNINEYNHFSILATVKPNGKLDNKIFLRFQHFSQQGHFNTVFDQLQIGYSFFVTKRLQSK